MIRPLAERGSRPRADLLIAVDWAIDALSLPANGTGANLRTSREPGLRPALGGHIGSAVNPREEPTMDTDRIEGKSKETEGEIQQKWGEAKDKARDTWEDVKDKTEDLVDGAEDRIDEMDEDDEPATSASSR
jgi:uncharacterized protein YjbJ (UPF0337 family)